MYEGTWWFTITDQSSSSYKVTTSRENFSDPRDMNSLKSQYLFVESINGQELECLNNFDELVSIGVSSANNPLIGEGLTSLNAMIENHTVPVSTFGNGLPEVYEISDGEVPNAPEWLNFKIDRSRGCGHNSQETVKLELPTSISCRLK